ncbi:MAG: glycosyltransferase [Puniceicoccales bacterium]|jgi:glycosyltransferase involved in cell wall biosynthesis|nr:glycosyltransferase [Puniceicoccales bacterium]
MKILHIVSTRHFAGTEQLVLTLASTLRNTEGCQSFLAVKRNSILGRRFKEIGLPVVPIPVNSLLAARRLAKWAEKNAIDIIHTHLTGAARIGLKIHKKTKLPLISHLHLLKDSPVYHAAAKVGVLVSISAHVTRFYKKLGVPEERLYTIPNATNAFFSPIASIPKEKLAAQIRAEIGVSPDARLLVFPGRVSPEKGHELFFNALPEILFTHPDVHVLIVGDIRQKRIFYKKLKTLAVKTGIAPRVHFTGFRQDILRFIRAAEAQLVLSDNEPFGLVLIEGMAMQTPVFATNAGSFPDILQQGSLGTLIPPANPTALANTINSFLYDSQPVKTLSAAAYTAASRLYTPDVFAANTFALYNKILRKEI